MSSCGALDIVLFFFSSRRRHTRLVSDWSSDVCSSDLKGRALLDRSQFAAAAAAVAGVPDTFHYDVTYSLVTADNQNWALNVNARRYTMADNEGDFTAGGNVGLPYFSANDPRLPRRRGGPNTKDGTISSDSVIFDTAYPLFVIRQGI